MRTGVSLESGICNSPGESDVEASLSSPLVVSVVSASVSPRSNSLALA